VGNTLRKIPVTIIPSAFPRSPGLFGRGCNEILQRCSSGAVHIFLLPQGILGAICISAGLSPRFHEAIRFCWWLNQSNHGKSKCMHVQFYQTLPIFQFTSILSLLKRHCYILLPKVQKFCLHLGYQLLSFLIHLLHCSAAVRQQVKGIQVLLVLRPVPVLMAGTGRTFQQKNRNLPGR